MHGRSGLSREQSHAVNVATGIVVRDTESTDHGVLEEQFGERLRQLVEAGIISTEQQAQLFYARHEAVLPREVRGIPVSVRSPGLGHVAISNFTDTPPTLQIVPITDLG